MRFSFSLPISTSFSLIVTIAMDSSCGFRSSKVRPRKCPRRAYPNVYRLQKLFLMFARLPSLRRRHLRQSFELIIANGLDLAVGEQHDAAAASVGLAFVGQNCFVRLLGLLG